MKLIKRNNDYWAITFGRNKIKSTGTKNKAEAQRIFNAVKSGKLEFNSGAKPINTSLLSEFMDEYLNSRHDKSAKTLAADELAIGKLIDFTGDAKLGEISTETIERFKIHCKASSLKTTSINTYLRHIRTFLNAACELEYIQNKITVKLLKTGKRLPRFLSDGERNAILDYAQKHNNQMYRIIELALYTGMRLGEIHALDYSNIINNGALLRIIGKGNKERIIPLLPQALAAMGMPCPTSGKVFDFSYEYISKQFKKIARECKIEDVHFHHLRHTAATYMVANGIDLLYVKEILGHADLSTTLIYSHVVNEKLRSEMGKLKY